MQDRLDELAKKAENSLDMPDPAALVTWNGLEDALEGARDKLEKSSSDTQGSSTELTRQTSEAVSQPLFIDFCPKSFSRPLANKVQGQTRCAIGSSVRASTTIRDDKQTA